MRRPVRVVTEARDGYHRPMRPVPPAPSPPPRLAPAARAGRARRRPGRAAALLLAALLAACDGPGPDAGTDGAPAPDVVFRTLAGERLALREARGPTLVSFWATSCAVCLREMPALARLRADYAPRGFELVAVAMPYDRPDRVLELAEARGWRFPVAIDIDGAVLAAFEPVPGTPTNVLVGADGRVLERRVGPLDVEALRPRLDALLAESPAPRT